MKTLAAVPFAAALLLSAAAAHADPATTTVDFSSGQQGFEGLGGFDGFQGTWIDDSVGQTAPALRTRIIDSFGINFGSSTNTAFLGDYTQSGSVTIGLDFNAFSITYLGREVSRNLIVELRDYDNPADGYPWTSVWYDFGTVSADLGWQHFEVTIGDTSSTELPSGWGGYGAEDPTTYEPVLPADRTFASVLSGVDEIVFTTFVPGYFYGFTNFDVAIDNISIAAVPEPATTALLLGGLGLVGVAARRRRAGAAA